MTDPRIQSMIDLAKSQIGYHEGFSHGHHNNVTKYAPEVPHLAWAQGQPWCAVFVYWLAMKSDLGPYFPETASVPAAAKWFKARHQWSEYPAVGAQAIFGNYAHTGFVVDYDDTYVWTVEGNAQPLTAKVLTPLGWVKMGDLRVGDEVIEPSGIPSVIEGIYPQGKRAVYRITLRDGSTTEACDQHLWRFKPGGAKPTVENTLRMKERVERGQRVNLPRISPVEFKPRTDLFIDPYALGVLLGDAYIRSDGVSRLTCGDPQIIDELRLAGIDVQQILVRGKPLPGTSEYRVNGVAQLLREFGVAGLKAHQKVIPERYMTGTVKDRLALLQGLMDTDGTIDATSRMEFTSSSHTLARQVQELVRSLGGRVAVNIKEEVYYTSPNQSVPKKARPAYRVQNIRLPDLIPFRLDRKVARWKNRTGGFGSVVVSVEYARDEEVQCIKVSAPSHLYVTDDYIPTHNTNNSGSPEGDGVYLKKHRRRDSWVLGYGYPDIPLRSADPSYPWDAEPTHTLGVDYSMARPSPATIKAAGYSAVGRYLSNYPKKNLSKSEQRALHAEGLGLWVVWENSAKRAGEGNAAGVDDAKHALGQANTLGLPNTCPIFFAVDFDATFTQVHAYLSGVQSVLSHRTGVYGGYRITVAARAAGIDYTWQTMAWSYGHVDTYANLFQRIHATVPHPIPSTDENVIQRNFPLWVAA